MNIKKVALTVLLIAIAIFFLQNKVLATSATERTTLLDLTTFTTDEANVNEGWSWNSASNTLTLTDVNFNTGDSSAIKVPVDRNINIVLNGKNKLTSNKVAVTRKETGNVAGAAVIFSGTGILEINSKKELPTIDCNNLILKSGTINAIGGSVNALDSIKVEGGKFTVDTADLSDNPTSYNDGFYALRKH